MKAVAGRSNSQWRGKGARAHFIPEFYDHDVDGWLVTQGLRQKPEGLHDDFVQTATLAAIDPQLIRMKQRVAAGKFHINGINLIPVENTIAWGRKIIAERTRVSAEAIQQSGLGSSLTGACEKTPVPVPFHGGKRQQRGSEFIGRNPGRKNCCNRRSLTHGGLPSGFACGRSQGINSHWCEQAGTLHVVSPAAR